MRRILSVILFASALAAQTTNYPGALDTASSLFVTADNVQTYLTQSMLAGDAVAIVKDTTGFSANMVVTICEATVVVTGSVTKCSSWEHMLVTAVNNANTLTVTRGIAGTVAAAHASGKLVSVLIDSAHQTSLKAAVIALETAVGANPTKQGTGTKYQMAGTNSGSSGAVLCNDGSGNSTTSACSIPTSTITTAAYNFTPYSCTAGNVCAPAGSNGGTLSNGVGATETLTPCPLGVNGSDSGHQLYISGGTGAAEVVTITGGSCTSGATTGTVTFTPGTTHSGAWTISSALGGVPEMAYALPNGGAVLITPGTYTLQASFTVPYGNTAYICLGAPDSCVFKQVAGGSFAKFFYVNALDRVTLDSLTLDGNFINTTSTSEQGVFGNSATNLVIRNSHFRYFGYTGAPTYNSTNFSNSAAILCVLCWNARINDNYFNSDWAYDIHGTGDGAEIRNNKHGTPNLLQVNTGTNYWDTQAGGAEGIVWSSSNDVKIVGNKIWGANRFYTASFVEGNPITTILTTRVDISDNDVSGMTPLPGTCSVTNANTGITCAQSVFLVGPPGDVGMGIECETAVGTVFKVATVNSATSITLTANYTGSTLSTARCRAQIANDAIQTYGSQYGKIENNTVTRSGDMGIDLNMYWDGVPADNVGAQHNTVSGNNVSYSLVCGYTLTLGLVEQNDFIGNKATNNHQGANTTPGARGGFCMGATPDAGVHYYIQGLNTFTGNSCIDTQGASPTQLECFDIDVGSWAASAFTANTFNGNLWSAGGSAGFSNEPISQPGALTTAMPAGVAGGTLLSSLAANTNSTGGAQTYTAAQMVNAILLRDPGAGGATDVTPTATALVNQVSGAIPGTSFAFYLRNTSAGANTITLTAGAGVTLSGPLHTVAQNQMRSYLCTITAVGTPAVTCYSMGTVTY